MSRSLRLAEQLISCRSITPDDAGCQTLIAQSLSLLGFECKSLVEGPGTARVTNLWALRRGTPGTKLLVFAGHTDVVPPGPHSAWCSDPFVPTHRDGKLYGRGAADMKTSIAAMIAAIEEFLHAHPCPAGSVAMLMTSDEEGESVDGTVRVCEWLAEHALMPDYCVVGEPTSVDRLGDVVKNGRRGSLSGKLTVKGVQGHIAYPRFAKNPIHLAAPALAELAGVEWDAGNDYFPPTGWQLSNVHAGTGVNNVIPGELVADFNFRFGSVSTPDALKTRLHDVLSHHGLDFELEWTLGAEPFLTPAGPLSDALSEAIKSETQRRPQLSTTGGTSDGRFIAKICSEVVEFGPVNASIHKIDEHVEVASIEPLKNIYRKTMELLLL